METISASTDDSKNLKTKALNFKLYGRSSGFRVYIIQILVNFYNFDGIKEQGKHIGSATIKIVYHFNNSVFGVINIALNF